MVEVPFFAVHGGKIAIAAVVVVATAGVLRYLGEPARRAKRRRRGSGLPEPSKLSEVSTGDRVTLEGKLLADKPIDVGSGAPVAVVSAVANPGKRDEQRHTSAADGLVLELGDRRVPIAGTCDLRTGSVEDYPRLSLAPERSKLIERLQETFGEAFETRRAPALLQVRPGDVVRAHGQVEAIAAHRETGYREASGDVRMTSEGGDKIVLWRAERPKARGNTFAGALWRAAWVGALVCVILYSAARVGGNLAVATDDPAAKMRLASLATLWPGERDRAVWLYTSALEELPPTRERGRALAGLFELEGQCGRAARELFARQDLSEAVATADRCASTEGEQVAVAALLLQGKLEESARRAEQFPRDSWRPDLPLALYLHAERWEDARRALSGASSSGGLKACIDAWLAIELGERPAEEPAWRESVACTNLRADQLEGKERLEFLRDHGSPYESIREPQLLLALEAGLDSGVFVKGDRDDHNTAFGAIALELFGADRADGADGADGGSISEVEAREQVIFDIDTRLSLSVRELESLFLDWMQIQAFEAPLGLSVAVADQAAPVVGHGVAWDLAPSAVLGAAFAALGDDHDAARQDAAGVHQAVEQMNAWRKAHEGHAPARALEGPRLAGLLSFLGGKAPEPSAVPRGHTYGLQYLTAQRRACAAGDTPSSRTDSPLEGFGRACRGNPEAIVEAEPDRLHPWSETRHILLAIAPALGKDARGLASKLAHAPLLPDVSATVDLHNSYILATQMRLIYDGLGKATVAELWESRSLALKGALLARGPAVPLAYLDQLSW